MSLIDPNWFEQLPLRTRLTLIGIALLLVLAAVGVVLWAFSGDPVRKEGELKANIGAANGQNAVVQNLVSNQEGVVANAAVVTEKATNALSISVNRDSSAFDGKNAGRRFCERFPQDSTCQKP